MQVGSIEENNNEVLSQEFENELTQVLNKGDSLGFSLTSWFSDPYGSGDTFSYLNDESDLWRKESKKIVYPIRESILLKGTLAIEPLNLSGEDDLDFIMDMTREWLKRIVDLGIVSFLNSDNTVLYNGYTIQVNPSLIRKLYLQVIPNVYASYFLNPRSTFDERFKQSKLTGIGTFIDIFFGFINEARKDTSLTTPELKRNALKNLSLKNGEMFKMMSIGLGTVLEIESNYISETDHSFIPDILSNVSTPNHYLSSNVKRKIQNKHIFSSNKDFLKQCPAAAALLIIVTKIVDALDDSFLMSQPNV